MAWTEVVGFEGAWVPEHHGSDHGYLPSPLTMLAAFAARIMTPRDAIAHIEAMLERAPVEHFMMFVPPGLPLAQFREYAELFATEVMPAFA